MEQRIYAYIQKAQEILLCSGHDRSKRHPFRSRSMHTRRVMLWAERLLSFHPEADREILLCAAAFHDVGYAAGTEGKPHQHLSGEVFLDYAREQGLDAAFTKRVYDCIVVHSDKYRMKTPQDLSIEQLLLMEADLLDEEGAMSICWDGLAAGMEQIDSYEQLYAKTARSLPGKKVNPMVTKEARAIWQKKAELIEMYVTQLKEDIAQFGQE